MQNDIRIEGLLDNGFNNSIFFFCLKVSKNVSLATAVLK